MITFLLVVHIIIAVGLVFFILMQHSEGGASGFVSGQMGGVMSVRGTANFLTKTTSILATLFFLSSIGLAIYAKSASKPKSIADSFKEHSQQEKKEDKPVAPVAPIAGQSSTTPATTPTSEPVTTPVAPADTAKAQTNETAPATTAPAATNVPAQNDVAKVATPEAAGKTDTVKEEPKN